MLVKCKFGETGKDYLDAKTTAALCRSKNALRLIGEHEYKDIDKVIDEKDIDRILRHGIDIIIELDKNSSIVYNNNEYVCGIYVFSYSTLKVMEFYTAKEILRRIFKKTMSISIIYKDADIYIDTSKIVNNNIRISDIHINILRVNNRNIIVPIINFSNKLEKYKVTNRIKEISLHVPADYNLVRSAVNEIYQFGMIKSLNTDDYWSGFSTVIMHVLVIDENHGLDRLREYIYKI